ncbi:MAG: hypothetical protein EPO25_00665 [Gammaproteobacteria bacterium]|nr:MAG: hypothetical protein EPO25_00665 [Gammaproteobacteria bacterium]
MKTPLWCEPGKLAVPRGRHHVLERRRALGILSGVLDRRLAVVSGPAGYGKTTVLAQLYGALAARGAATAWLTLDNDDRLEKRFLACTVIALARVARPFGRLVEAAGQYFQGIPVATVRAAILQACARTSQHLVLLLDDYDAVPDDALGPLLEFLLERMPANLHLVLAARSTPRLPIATLTVRDEVIQIGVNDLRFAADEASLLFAADASRRMTAAELQTLMDKTEGWPIALQLARALLATPAHEHPDLGEMTGRAALVSHYLMEQVFQRLPVDARQVLLATAPLPRFNGDLANALCGRDDGWQVIADLERRGLFVVPLDAEHEWFRYHRMFQEFLCERLRREPGMTVSGQCIAAAEWFAARDDVDDAIALYQQAGEHGRVADLLDSRRIWRLLGAADEARLGRLLSSVPQQLSLERPRLHLARIMLGAPAGASGNLAAELAEFRRRHGAKLSGEPRLDREIKVFETMYRQGALDEPPDRAMLEAVERTVVAGDDADEVELAVLQYSCCSACLDYCEFDECERLASEAMHHFFQVNLPYAGRWLDVFVALCHAARGQLEQASRVLDRARAAMAGTFGPDTDLGAMVDVVTAELAYERNDPQQAAALLDTSLLRATAAGGWINVYATGFRTAAALARLRDGPDAALEVMSSARALARRKGSARLERFAAVLSVRELSLAGRIPEAVQQAGTLALANEARAQVAARLGWQLWDPEAAVAARLLVATGEPGRAIAILRPLREEFMALGCLRQRIGITNLLALALRAGGQTKAALSEAAEALQLAAAGGFTRLFLDEGPVLLELLADARATTPSLPPAVQEFADRLLAQAVAAPSPASPEATAGAGELSPRELDILERIGRGLSSKEMARELRLSENTVKFYRKSLYRKLRISARSEAVAAARRLLSARAPARRGPA